MISLLFFSNTWKVKVESFQQLYLFFVWIILGETFCILCYHNFNVARTAQSHTVKYGLRTNVTIPCHSWYYQDSKMSQKVQQRRDRMGYGTAAVFLSAWSPEIYTWKISILFFLLLTTGSTTTGVAPHSTLICICVKL